MLRRDRTVTIAGTVCMIGNLQASVPLLRAFYTLTAGFFAGVAAAACDVAHEAHMRHRTTLCEGVQGIREVMPPIFAIEDRPEALSTQALPPPLNCAPLPKMAVVEKGESLDEFVERAAPDFFTAIQVWRCLPAACATDTVRAWGVVVCMCALCCDTSQGTSEHTV